MTLPWYENAIGHFFAGITISLADRAFSGNARRHAGERIESKLGEVTALEYIVRNSGDVSSLGREGEYTESVMRARNYFARRGIDCTNEPNSKGSLRYLSGKFGKVVAHLRRGHEKINNLPVGNKLLTAFGIELALDATVVATHAVYGTGNSLHALGLTPVQTLALFGGMQTGKCMLYIRDSFVKSKEEKELDLIGRELTDDGKLLELVRNYSPTRDIEVRLVESIVLESVDVPEKLLEHKPGYSADEIGRKVGDTIGDVAGATRKGIGSAIDAIRERLATGKQAKEDEDERRKSELAKRYEKY